MGEARAMVVGTYLVIDVALDAVVVGLVLLLEGVDVEEIVPKIMVLHDVRPEGGLAGSFDLGDVVSGILWEDRTSCRDMPQMKHSLFLFSSIFSLLALSSAKVSIIIPRMTFRTIVLTRSWKLRSKTNRT